MMESWKQRDANIACAGKNKKTKKKNNKTKQKKQQVNQVLVRDNSFSTYPKISEKLTFLSPRYAHVLVVIKE